MGLLLYMRGDTGVGMRVGVYIINGLHIVLRIIRVTSQLKRLVFVYSYSLIQKNDIGEI